MVITNYLSGPVVITEVLWRKEQTSGMPGVVTMESKFKEWERFEDATLLALKMEEGDANRGKQAATRSQDRKKGRERDSALVSPERTPARHCLCFSISDLQSCVVQSPSHVRLFVAPWTAAHLAPPSSTVFQSLLKFMAVELVMLSNHFILCRPPSSPALNLSQHQGLFQWVSFLTRWSKIGALASSLVLPVNIQG